MTFEWFGRTRDRKKVVGMDPRTLAEAAGLAALATANVGLWTLRVAVAAAGRRFGRRR